MTSSTKALVTTQEVSIVKQTTKKEKAILSGSNCTGCYFSFGSGDYSCETTTTTMEYCLKARSIYDPSFKYEKGETVTPRKLFDENILEECESGIHMFETKEEAVDFPF